MRELLDQMARASYQVHAADDPTLGTAWEELRPERRELFRRAVGASLEVALKALSDAGAHGVGRAAEIEELRSATESALSAARVTVNPDRSRRKVGPEDEERGQQAGDLPFNQRND